MNNNINNKSNFDLILLLSIIIILVCYSNTLNSSWHFDDLGNIVDNDKVHISTISYSDLKEVIFARADGDDSIHRPVSFLSFAINWYFGGDNVVGYHIVNIVIHIFCYLVLLNLLNCLVEAPVFHQLLKEDLKLIALPTALLWAVNPIQIQAVTYIVQRVASLAALFYLCGMLCYVKFRNNTYKKNNYFFLLLVFVFFLLAIGSKEHAITFPVAIFMLEIFFYRKNTIKLSNPMLISIVILIIAFFVCGIIYYFNSGIPDTFNYKSFSLTDRLMTEARVVFFYISQIIYPVPSRLSLIHYFPISRGLFAPPTTIIAIIGITILIWGCIYYRKKQPILCFSILFFFMAHIVESTVLPLELVFEHRNYLPSVFIFWPISFFLVKLIRNVRKPISFAIITICAAYMLSLAAWTYQRNFAWESEETLWGDVAKKYPEIARSYQYVAMSLAASGEKLKAIELYKRSLDKYDDTPGRSVWLAYNNMGVIYMDLGQWSSARESFEKALDAMPEDAGITFPNLIRVYINQRDYKGAEILVNRALALNPDNGDYLNTKGFICLKTHRPEESIRYFKKAKANFIDRKIADYNTAMALTMAEKSDEALALIQIMYSTYGQDLTLNVMQVENYLRLEDFELAEEHIKTIMQSYPLSRVQRVLIDKPDHLPFNLELLKPAFENEFEKQLMKLE